MSKLIPYSGPMMKGSSSFVLGLNGARVFFEAFHKIAVYGLYLEEGKKQFKLLGVGTKLKLKINTFFDEYYVETEDPNQLWTFNVMDFNELSDPVDSTPMAVSEPGELTMDQKIKKMIRMEAEKIRSMQDDGPESEEEANDFEIDELEGLSPYEFVELAEDFLASQESEDNDDDYESPSYRGTDEDEVNEPPKEPE